MGVYVPSEEELEARGGDSKFSLMGEDNYLVEVKELKVEKRPNPYDNGKLRDTAMVKLTVISFENGEPLYDADGNDTNDRIFFDFIEVEKLGMKPRPSKARKFIAACMNQPVAAAITLDDWQDLVGKRIIAHAVIKKNGKNGIDDYRPVRARRRPNAETAATAAPVAMPGETIKGQSAPPAEDAVDLVQVAKDIFDDDPDF
jgi:hypothetical protein